jgi:pimeloyl-ACP methyl ester carboxylesterase
MTGLGERAHLLSPSVNLQTFIDDAMGILVAEEIDRAILVGHSFGGMVISGLADRVPERIERLIYLDAIVPESGRSALDLLPPDIAATRRAMAESSSGGLSIPTPAAAAFDIPAGPDRDWVARRITPHPLAAYADPLMLNRPVGNGVPRTYVRCTEPVYAAVQPSYARVESEPDWTLLDLATGHDAMITAPDALAALLLAISAEDR